MSSDMNLFDLFSDTFLKGEIKDDLFVDDNYGDIAAAEESPAETEDLFASILKMEEDTQLGFNLIDKDLETIQSSSSDSGLSSALSLSYEQQLSPFLSKVNEEEHIEISNSDLSSPQNFMDFEPAASPSLASVDSPVRSVVSSNIGSPATDVTEEIDYEQTLVAVVTPNNTTPNGNTVVAEQPIVDISPAHKQTTTYVIPRESAARNLTGNGKRSIRQFVRVTPVGSGNPRSILLPISLKDVKEVRTIKLMTTQAKNFKNLKMNQANIINKPIQMTIKTEETNSEKSSNSSDEVTSETDSPYPRLKLNAEEKRLLQKEGITLPSHYPLTKHEERELKRIRRKIRNKISAQDSRKRKKEYVDGLEDRVKQCTQENVTLLNQIEALQTQNKSLTNQLKRLQTLLQKGNKSAQPATCLVVLLLSLVLVALPNGLQPHSNNNSDLTQEQEPEQTSLAGRSRTLLHTKQLIDEELQQYGEELLQEVGGLLDHDYSPVVQMPLYKRPRLDNEAPSKYASSMNHVGGTLGLKPDLAVSKTKGQYMEPPLDDVWPPPNPGGQKTTRVVDKLEALTNELKINISDVEGTRTVFVKMPHDK
ncbi:uncharacterized protein LOC109855862 [Pseudomyrmex gracilis]|uniref:uncharacterized protein LOC109855862 n=1 Tax=Pseudomyrmex gracilis TaxID=219809 RepID=UPI000995B6FA|nr:uncharacterized protein LOC109855862 [Pseudomyrmex gracilis]